MTMIRNLLVNQLVLLLLSLLIVERKWQVCGEKSGDEDEWARNLKNVVAKFMPRTCEYGETQGFMAYMKFEIFICETLAASRDMSTLTHAQIRSMKRSNESISRVYFRLATRGRDHMMRRVISSDTFDIAGVYRLTRVLNHEYGFEFDFEYPTVDLRGVRGFDITSPSMGFVHSTNLVMDNFLLNFLTGKLDFYGRDGKRVTSCRQLETTTKSQSLFQVELFEMHFTQFDLKNPVCLRHFAHMRLASLGFRSMVDTFYKRNVLQFDDDQENRANHDEHNGRDKLVSRHSANLLSSYLLLFLLYLE